MLKKVLYSLLFTSLLLTGLSVQGHQFAGQIATVTARYLNVRQGPSINTTILAVVHRGEMYQVLGKSGTWWQISVGNISGYVNGRYVTVSGGDGVTATPVVPVPTGTACSNVVFFSSTPADICTGSINHTQAAFQSFEHGFMVWMADSGDIWVFMNAPNGVQPPWMHIPENYYAGFADAKGSAPAGLVQPINGFGRVWANYHGFSPTTVNKLSDDMGWATASEVSYSSTWQNYFRTMHTHTYLTVPDGRVVDAYSGLAGTFWSFVQ